MVTRQQTTANTRALRSGWVHSRAQARDRVLSTLANGFGLVVSVVLATLLAGPVAAANATLRIEPAAVAVVKDGSFWVKVVQDAPLATSGAQVSMDFDPSILQVVSLSRASAYADAPIFLPQDINASIRSANVSGRLAQIAAAFTPPDAVPAGTSAFLLVMFRVVGCGQTDITLPSGGPFDAQMISGQSDLYGHEVPVATSNGHVTTCVGPGAATAGAPDEEISNTAGGDVPIGLIGGAGIAAVLSIGLLGALAWRSRRRGRLDDIAR